MCSIAGGCALTGVDSLKVNNMLWRQIHRGRCEPRIWIAPECILGHTRLAIVGGESNTQPLVLQDVAITFNGEIYNYKELRRELQSKGIVFTTDGDTEVIAQMYLAYGPLFVQRLTGIFAFAIYDLKNKRLLLCRDRVGVKPLYYTLKGNTLLFASEIKAFREKEVNLIGLCQYLQFQHCLGATTMLKHVVKVQPGELLLYTAVTGALQTLRYWDVPTQVIERHPVYYPERIDSVLHQVIKEQATCDVEVGAYVSGGLDSSVVSSLLVERVPNARLFTGYYNVHGYSEKAHVDILVEYLTAFKDYDAAGYTAFEITADDAIATLPKAIYHMDEPCAGPGLIGQYILAKKIKQAYPDHKVMYGGQGGDELFGGYSRYLVACLEAHLYGCIYPQYKDRTFSTEDLLSAMQTLQGYEPMLRHTLGTGFNGSADSIYYQLICRTPENTLSPEFTHLLLENKSEVYEEYNKIMRSVGELPFINRMAYFDLVGSLPALLQVDDRVNAAFEMESRVPLLDDSLLELAFTMPPKHKYQAGTTKGILRHAMLPHLPEAIVLRKDKMGFPVPLQAWLTYAPFKEFVVDTCRSSSLATQLFTQLKPDSLVFDRGLWGRLSIALWQQQFSISTL